MDNKKEKIYSPRPPCARDCENRGPGCGTTCEAWLEYVEKRNAAYKARAEETERRAMTTNALRIIKAKSYYGKTNKRSKGK